MTLGLYPSHPVHPARIRAAGLDEGRSPGSWVTGVSRLLTGSKPNRQWHPRSASPFTVAGAAAASPRAVFCIPVSTLSGHHHLRIR